MNSKQKDRKSKATDYHFYIGLCGKLENQYNFMFQSFYGTPYDEDGIHAVHIGNKNLKVGDKLSNVSLFPVQNSMETMINTSFPYHGFVLLVDPTERDCLKRLKNEIDKINDYKKNNAVFCIAVINADEPWNHKIPHHNISAFANELGFPCYKLNLASDNGNAKIILNNITTMCIEKKEGVELAKQPLNLTHHEIAISRNASQRYLLLNYANIAGQNLTPTNGLEVPSDIMRILKGLLFQVTFFGKDLSSQIPKSSAICAPYLLPIAPPEQNEVKQKKSLTQKVIKTGARIVTHNPFGGHNKRNIDEKGNGESPRER